MNISQHIAFLCFFIPSALVCVLLPSSLEWAAFAFAMGPVTCMIWYDTVAKLEE